jgi:hypothetical protein
MTTRQTPSRDVDPFEATVEREAGRLRDASVPSSFAPGCVLRRGDGELEPVRHDVVARGISELCDDQTSRNCEVVEEVIP